MKKLYLWLSPHLQGRYGTLLFIVLVATEGFFVIPVSALLIFFCLENRSKAFTYATLATVLTGISALLGYLIGYLLHQTGSYYLLSPETVQSLSATFTEYQAFSSFIIALSPIPYKTVTITAGFLGVPLVPFIPLSIAARGIRFFALASAIHFWGTHLKYNHFYWLLGLGALIISSLWYIVS